MTFTRVGPARQPFNTVQGHSYIHTSLYELIAVLQGALRQRGFRRGLTRLTRNISHQAIKTVAKALCWPSWRNGALQDGLQRVQRQVQPIL